MPPCERDGSSISGRTVPVKSKRAPRGPAALLAGRRFRGEESAPCFFEGEKSQPRKRVPPFRPRPRMAFCGGGGAVRWPRTAGAARRAVPSIIVLAFPGLADEQRQPTRGHRPVTSSLPALILPARETPGPARAGWQAGCRPRARALEGSWLSGCSIVARTESICAWLFVVYDDSFSGPCIILLPWSVWSAGSSVEFVRVALASSHHCVLALSAARCLRALVWVGTMSRRPEKSSPYSY